MMTQDERNLIYRIKPHLRTSEQLRGIIDYIGSDVAEPVKRHGVHNYYGYNSAFKLLLPSKPLFQNFSLCTTELAPFEDQEESIAPYAMAVIYGAGRIAMEGDVNELTVDKAIVVASGEILAPGLPQSLWLDKDCSRAKLIRVMRIIMLNREVLRPFGFCEVNLLDKNNFKGGLTPEYRMEFGNSRWANISLPVNIAMKILYILAETLIEMHPSIVTRMLLANVVTVIKKGSVTSSCLSKITQAMKSDLQLDITISNSLIIDLYRAYGPYMTSQSARIIIQDWKKFIPENSRRLHFMVAQAIDKGLTAFVVVKRAYKECPNFDWRQLAMMPTYRREMVAYLRAAEIIKDDRYYGFNQELGLAKSKYYKNLATVCSRLLQRATGNLDISRAECFQKILPVPSRVDQLINQYFEGLKETKSSQVAQNFIDFFQKQNGENRPSRLSQQSDPSTSHQFIESSHKPLPS